MRSVSACAPAASAPAQPSLLVGCSAVPPPGRRLAERGHAVAGPPRAWVTISATTQSWRALSSGSAGRMRSSAGGGQPLAVAEHLSKHLEGPGVSRRHLQVDLHDAPRGPEEVRRRPGGPHGRSEEPTGARRVPRARGVPHVGVRRPAVQLVVPQQRLVVLREPLGHRQGEAGQPTVTVGDRSPVGGGQPLGPGA